MIKMYIGLNVILIIIIILVIFFNETWIFLQDFGLK